MMSALMVFARCVSSACLFRMPLILICRMVSFLLLGVLVSCVCDMGVGCVMACGVVLSVVPGAGSGVRLVLVLVCVVSLDEHVVCCGAFGCVDVMSVVVGFGVARGVIGVVVGSCCW